MFDHIPHDSKESKPKKLHPNEKEGGSDERLDIKVTDGNNEVFFKIKRATTFEKLMNAFCFRQGKQLNACRFFFDGTRVQSTDSADTLDMMDGDTIEVHSEQIGGGGGF